MVCSPTGGTGISPSQRSALHTNSEQATKQSARVVVWESQIDDQ
jgi:hypothetical protein